MTNAPLVPVTEALEGELWELRAELLAHGALPIGLRRETGRQVIELERRLRAVPVQLAKLLTAVGAARGGVLPAEDPVRLDALVVTFSERAREWGDVATWNETRLRTALDGGAAPESMDEELARIFDRPGEPPPWRPGLVQIIDDLARLVSRLERPAERDRAERESIGGFAPVPVELTPRERAAFDRLRQEEGLPVGQSALASAVDGKVRDGSRKPTDEAACSVARSAVKALKGRLAQGAVDGVRWAIEEDHTGKVRYSIHRIE